MTERDSPENPGQRHDIQLSLKSIVRSSDRWLERLKKRESRARLANSFLVALLVFWGAGAVFLGFVISQYGWAYLRVLFHDQNLAYSIAGVVGLAGLVTGYATYLLMGRRHDAQLKELSSMVLEMKKIEEEQRTNGSGGEGIPKYALSLADKIIALLPEISRRRDPDSLLFGLVAFVAVSAVGGNLIWAIPAGIVVWLSVRYLTSRRYRNEISKFEKQKRVFDERKKDFIETL